MCDRSNKLVSWLDHELPETEAADVEGHLRDCAECRTCLAAYKRVDQAVDAYCDQVMVKPLDRKLPSWAPVLSGAMAAAVLFLIFRPGHADRLPPHAQGPAAPIAFQASSPAPRHEKPHPWRAATLVARTNRPTIQSDHAGLPRAAQGPAAGPSLPMASDATIQIAIPVDTMFAPGALPEGMNVIAELRLASDGSAQDLRLRP
jgi:anti-sigma factor RsiW